MNQQEFIKDFATLEQWINSMRPHWAYLNGDVFNDKDFWSQCIHSVKPETWIAWCNIYGELNQSHPEYFRKHSYIYEDTVTVATRIDKGQAISKPYNKTGYNKPAFRAAMAIKDIVAEITERPFATTVNEPVKKKSKPTVADILAHYEQGQAMLKELFSE